MKKFLPSSKGFTLIELMVVVTIIAFLSVIGIVAFGNAQKQARDGRRRGDIDAIAVALEANRNQLTGIYPTLTDAMFAKGKIPNDPSAGETVTTTACAPSATLKYCTIDLGTTAFTVCAKLEIVPPNGNFNIDLTVNPTNTGVLYCRKSQQ